MNNQNPTFAAGQRVRCISSQKDLNACAAYECFGSGKIYTVQSFRKISNDNFITVAEHPHVELWARRFELVAEGAKPLGINIKIDSNVFLWELYQKLAFAHGIYWPGKKTDSNISPCRYLYLSLAKHSFLHENTLYWDNREEFGEKLVTFDGATDFKKIEAILKMPSQPVIVAPSINGYTAKYEKGERTVKFGCAKIAIELFDDAKDIMNAAYNGNRMVSKIVLDSGVTITREEVEKTLKYVSEIDTKK